MDIEHLDLRKSGEHTGVVGFSVGPGLVLGQVLSGALGGVLGGSGLVLGQVLGGSLGWCWVGSGWGSGLVLGQVLGGALDWFWVGFYFEVTLMYAGKVPALQHCKLPLVGVGKHLCGAATGESWDR